MYCDSVFFVILIAHAFLYSASKHYHLAMHVIGRMTQARTMHELDDVFISAAVVFSSPCSAVNVEKHFQNLQVHLQGIDLAIDEAKIEEEEFGVCT